MAVTPPAGFENGLFGEAKDGEHIEIAFVLDGEVAGSYVKNPRALSGDVALLLRLGIQAHAKNGKPVNQKIEKILADNPTPVSTLGLLPNPKSGQVTLCLFFGNVVIPVGLPTSMCNQLGQALQTASATGDPS